MTILRKSLFCDLYHKNYQKFRNFIRCTVCCGLIWLPASAQELVIGTTFSSSATEELIQQWLQQNPQTSVRLINRTTGSLEKLLQQSTQVDLVLSSSPFLFERLQQKSLLLPLSISSLYESFVPKNLRQTTHAIGFSGYGILFNRKLLANHQLSEPDNWENLFNPNYRENIIISSPSRSGTNHLIVEMLLQHRGWQQGWQTLLNFSGNLSMISSRSFNVAEKVKQGLAIAGVTIDSYALPLLADNNLGFHYLPDSVASPTFIAIHRESKSTSQAVKFIEFLYSKTGQQTLLTSQMRKFPLQPLAQTHQAYTQQQTLLHQPSLNHDLLLQRQKLIERLFDITITFRLATLKDLWQALYEKERQLGKPLHQVRDNLTAMPMSAEQATDHDFLTRFEQDRTFALEQEQLWREFFQQHLEQARIALEEAK